MQGALSIIIDIIYLIYNVIMNSLGRLLFFIFNNDSWKLLRRNRVFKQIHQGERCFVIGNGPSLKDQDLSLIEGEVIFTVNQAIRNPQYSKFRSAYHFWMDQNFFRIDIEKPEDQELLGVMKETSSFPDSPICFYPINMVGFIKSHELNKGKEAYYLCNYLKMHSKFSAKPTLNWFIPSYGTVIQYAIYTAIYMGFKEIYLLGCDSTGIMSTLNAIMKTNNDTYAYKVSSNEKLRMQDMVAHSSVVDYAYSYYASLKSYQILRKYCEKHRVLLLNSTPQSVLDMLVYKDLKNVIENN